MIISILNSRFIPVMSDLPNLVHFNGSAEDLVTLVKDASGLVVIDFFADWCGPCRNLARQFLPIVRQYPNVKFVKVNIDENKEAAGNFQVNSIPYLVFAKGLTDEGEVNSLQVIQGAPMSVIKAAVQKHQ
jgi:thioredoxin 1